MNTPFTLYIKAVLVAMFVAVAASQSQAFTPSTSTNIFQGGTSSGDVQPLGSDNGDERYNLGLMAPFLANLAAENGGLIPDLTNTTLSNDIINGYLERSFEPNTYGVPAGFFSDIVTNNIYGDFLLNEPQSRIFDTTLPSNLPAPSNLYGSAQFSQVVAYFQELTQAILKTTDNQNDLAGGIYDLLNADYGSTSGDITLFSKTESDTQIVYLLSTITSIGTRTYSNGAATNSTVTLPPGEKLAGIDSHSPIVKVEILLDRGTANGAGVYELGTLRLRITIEPPAISGITYGDSFIALTMEAPIGFSMGIATIRYLIAINTRGQSQFTFYPEGQGPGESGFDAYTPFEVYALLRAILANDNP